MTERRRNGKTRRLLILIPVLLAAAATAVLLTQKKTEGKTGGEVQVFLDGNLLDGQAEELPEGCLGVHITLDGAPLLDLPFGEAHTVRILQQDGGENTVTMTGDAVWMSEANCEGQDCVQMGEVTEDNLELRVMGGFIICLPHRIAVEIR